MIPTMKLNQNWAKCGRDPEKIISEFRRECRAQGIELEERQNGSSHWVGKTSRGLLVVPRGHGDLKTGTHCAIMKALAAMGFALVLLIIIAQI